MLTLWDLTFGEKVIIF